jgi:uncharacterized membrane protein HdeD (DUF308 family)
LLESALAPGGWKVWHHIVAVIFVLGALWGFVRPVNTFFALASVLVLILIFYGSFEIIQGVASRAVNPWWWVNLITGILLLLLALFRGFTQIMLAFGVRHAGEEAAARLGDTGRLTAEPSKTTLRRLQAP